MKPPLHLYGRNGLGDAVYTRALVHAVLPHRELYLSTAWPELFHDLPVRCVRPTTPLRGPTRNVARYPDTFWHTVPTGTVSRSIKYRWRQLARAHLLAQLAKGAGVKLHPYRFDAPPLPTLAVPGTPLAIVRPVTHRMDWPNPARNPDAAYLAHAAEALMARGFHVLSLADLVPGQEELVGPPVVAHTRLEHGELAPLELMGLVAQAAVVVSPVGWAVPVCVAVRTPLIVVGGGRGGCDAPECLLHPRMRSAPLAWLLPDRFCRCTKKHHSCPKTITDFPARFAEALELVTHAEAHAALAAAI